MVILKLDRVSVVIRTLNGMIIVIKIQIRAALPSNAQVI